MKKGICYCHCICSREQLECTWINDCTRTTRFLKKHNSYPPTLPLIEHLCWFKTRCHTRCLSLGILVSTFFCKTSLYTYNVVVILLLSFCMLFFIYSFWTKTELSQHRQLEPSPSSATTQTVRYSRVFKQILVKLLDLMYNILVFWQILWFPVLCLSLLTADDITLSVLGKSTSLPVWQRSLYWCCVQQSWDCHSWWRWKDHRLPSRPGGSDSSHRWD